MTVPIVGFTRFGDLTLFGVSLVVGWLWLVFLLTLGWWVVML